MDNCDRCNQRAELYHNEATGLALCEDCDMAEERKAVANVFVAGTQVVVDGVFTGTVVGSGFTSDGEPFVVVEWQQGFWAWKANGTGSKAVAAAHGPDTFVSRGVVHPDNVKTA